MAFGKVFCFGPTFRAEKSKTRRHLTEFWMLEPEVAYATIDEIMDLAEDFIVTIVQAALDRCAADLAVLERDASKLIPPLHGALLKNEQDVHLFERLAFLARRERN